MNAGCAANLLSPRRSDLELALECGPSQAIGVRPSSGATTSETENTSLHSTLAQTCGLAAPGDGRPAQIDLSQSL
jgi:hypothetical protein